MASLTHNNSPKTLTKAQHVRRYASDAPPKAGNNSVLYTGIGAAGLAGGYLYLRGGDSPSGQQGAAPPSAEGSKIPALTGEVNKAFTGGEQGFLSLVLEKSEIVNHNTKKLRFKLPEEDMESGLPVACMSISRTSRSPHMLTEHSGRYYQVQGPRDAEASYPTIHPD